MISLCLFFVTDPLILEDCYHVFHWSYFLAKHNQLLRHSPCFPDSSSHLLLSFKLSPNLSMSSLKCGAPNWMQYSKWGLITAEQSGNITLHDLDSMHLLIQPSTWNSRVEIPEMLSASDIIAVMYRKEEFSEESRLVHSISACLASQIEHWDNINNSASKNWKKAQPYSRVNQIVTEDVGEQTKSVEANAENNDNKLNTIARLWSLWVLWTGSKVLLILKSIRRDTAGNHLLFLQTDMHIHSGRSPNNIQRWWLPSMHNKIQSK